MKTHLVAAAAAGLVLYAGAAFADAKSDLAALDGSWHLTSMAMDGKQAPPEAFGNFEFAVKGDGYRVSDAGRDVETGTVKLDPSKTPGELDFDIATGNDKGKKQLGIYKIEGEAFTFVVAAPGAPGRPKEFKSEGGFAMNTMKKGAPAPAASASPAPAASAAPSAAASAEPSAAPSAEASAAPAGSVSPEEKEEESK